MDTKIYLVNLEQLDTRAFRITVQVSNCPKELKPEVLADLLKDLMEGITHIVKGETK